MPWFHALNLNNPPGLRVSCLARLQSRLESTARKKLQEVRVRKTQETADDIRARKVSFELIEYGILVLCAWVILGD